jgi:ATP-binding cassette subfamily B protein
MAPQWRLALVMAAGPRIDRGGRARRTAVCRQMVDALADVARSRDVAVLDALGAFAAIVGLGVALVILRYGLFKGIVRFTLRMMSDVAHETFWRVQRFSTDWHANSFAGATVRKLTRGVWAFDLLNDTVLVALWPSSGRAPWRDGLFGWHWPSDGPRPSASARPLCAGDGEAVARLRHARDRALQRLGQPPGRRLADAVSCNPVVKAFGARRPRGHAPGRVLARWRRRTWVTWTRHILTGSLQQSILMVLRVVVIGLALLFWWQGTATLGDVTFVLTAYGVINGYLRDIGHHVQNVQKSTSDLEELVAFHERPLGVENRTGAGELVIARGDIEFDQVRFRYPALDRQVYDELSIRIPAGQRVGLVGRSGSGKTTFVKLVQRLYDLDGGRITIDGQDIAASARRACGGRWRSCSRSRCCSIARWPTTSPMAGPTPRRPRSRRRRGSPTPTCSSSGCRSATPPWWASAASSSRAANASGWRWRAPSWPMRRS